MISAATFAHFVLLLCIFSSNSDGKLIFGENCAEGDICSKDFVCGSKNTCECRENQGFDSSSGKCLNLIGQSCTSSSECLPYSTCSPEWITKLGKFQQICRCIGKSYFINQVTKTCELSAKHGDLCNDTIRPCQDAALLTCSPQTSTCVCENEKVQNYNPQTQKCGIRVGEPCYYLRSQTDACISNAHCQYYFAMKKIPFCHCNAGYFKGNKNGDSCLASHMQTCNATSICHTSAGLICTDGQCLCESPMQQVFNYHSHNCEAVVGADCSSTPCIENGICNSNLKCECAEGFSETSDKKSCKLNFNTTCDSWKVDTCNHDRGLVCKGNKCVCFDSSFQYNSKLNLCVNNEGNVCGKLKQKRIQRKGRNKLEIEGLNSIVVGCDDGLICAKLQGKESCYCFAVQAVESDRTFRIDLCL